MVKRLYKKGGDATFLDDRHEILNVYLSPCVSCKHFMEDDFYCDAYPDGIPDRILEGNSRHDTPQPDQTGDTLYAPED